MSRRSKRKKKKRKQKAVLKAPHQPSQPPSPIAAKSRTQFWTMLGLLLTAIGLVALIELFPRLSSTAASPTDPEDILGSSKFTVVNDGYLRVTDVMSVCFLWKVQIERPGASAHFDSSLARIVEPPKTKLSPTEGYTIPCTTEGRPIVGTSPPYAPLRVTQADLVIVSYYRAWPFTFYRDHRLFRFVAHVGKQGEITWEKQPAAILEPDYDNFIQTHGGTFPPQPPHLPKPN